MPDFSDPTPVREQIANDLREQIIAGKYAPEDRIPANTALATHYGVAAETIRSALDELRSEGIVETRSTRGTFVTGKPAADRVQVDLRTVGAQLAELAKRTEGYDDLRAEVERIAAKVGRMQADILYLYDRFSIEYDHGGEHDGAEESARQAQEG